MRSMDEDVELSAEALMRCLESLSEEAASMSLCRTFAALRDAIDTCRKEARAGVGATSGQSGAGLIH